MYINKKIAYFTDDAVPSTDEAAEITALEAKLYMDADGTVNDHLHVHVRRKNFDFGPSSGEGDRYSGVTYEDFDAVAAFYDDVPTHYDSTAFPLASDSGVETFFLCITPVGSTTVDTTLQLACTCNDGLGNVTDVTTTATWASDDTGAAGVGAHTGLVTAVAGVTGGVTITATYKGSSTTKHLIVT